MTKAPDEQRVLAAISWLVGAGEYLDEIPGVPGARLSGGGVFRNSCRLYARRSPEYREAKAAGLVQRLPPLRVASIDAVKEAEQTLGLELPAFLRRLYLEVGNGGFGPGYGLLGLSGGHTTEGATALDMALAYRDPKNDWPQVSTELFPICNWGCGILSFVDCRDDVIWGFDPNPVSGPEAMFRAPYGLVEWFARWIDGRLMQPTVVQDETTGRWRGATDEEVAHLMAES